MTKRWIQKPTARPLDAFCMFVCPIENITVVILCQRHTRCRSSRPNAPLLTNHLAAQMVRATKWSILRLLSFTAAMP